MLFIIPGNMEEEWPGKDQQPANHIFLCVG